MKRFELILCLMLIGFMLALLPVPAQAVTWKYYDVINQQMVNPTVDEVERLAAKRISDTNETHFALRIGHDFTKGIETGYLENIGNPSPAVGLTWIPQGQAVNATVNGTVGDTNNMDIRYIVSGFTGNAPINQQFKALALQFDGSDDYAQVDNVPLGGTASSGTFVTAAWFSVQFYAKRNRLNVAEAVFSQGSAATGNGVEAGFTDKNEAYFTVYGYPTVHTGSLPTTNEWHNYKFYYAITQSDCSHGLSGCYGFSVSIYVDDMNPSKSVDVFLADGTTAGKSQAVQPVCIDTPKTVDNIVWGCYDIVDCATNSSVPNQGASGDGYFTKAIKDLTTAKNHWNSGNISAWTNSWANSSNKLTKIPHTLCADKNYDDACDSVNSKGMVYCRGNFVPDNSGAVNGPCYNKWFSKKSGDTETRAWSSIWSEIKRQGTGNPATTTTHTYSCTPQNYASQSATLYIGKGLTSGKNYNGQIRDAEVIRNGATQAKWAFKDGGTSTTAADASGQNHPAALKNMNTSVAWISPAAEELFTPLKFTEDQQKISFTMTAPAKLIYKWETQYAATVNSVPSTISCNGIYSNFSYQYDNGKHWFPPGTEVHLYANDEGCTSCLQIQGYLDNANPGVTVTSKNLSKTLTEPIGITWVYGDFVYQETVTVGSPVSLYSIPMNQREIIRDQKPSYVSLNVTENDMCVWSDFEKKIYPIRGDESFDLEFSVDDPSCPEKRINLRVITKWPPSPHYIHVADTPAVNLDPSPDDIIAFQGMKYTEENTKAAVSGTDFTASGKGRSVLLFTRTYTDAIYPKDISLLFDGVNDYAEAQVDKRSMYQSEYYSSTSNNIYHFTISFWAKVKGGNGKERTAISNIDNLTGTTNTPAGFNIGVSPGEKWRFTYYTGTDTPFADLQSTSTVKYDEWAHISVVFDFNILSWTSSVPEGTSNAFLYINGSREAQFTSGSKFVSNALRNILRIGTNTKLVSNGGTSPAYTPKASTNYFNGQIEDITIWRATKSDAEILAIMNGDFSDADSSLFAHWRFDKPGLDSAENSSTLPSYNVGVAKLFNMDPVTAYITEKEPPSGEPAKGDLSSEYVYVRVVETRNRDDDKFPLTATVGKEIFSPYHDEEVPHNGYVFYEIGPYNADIYNRAATNGPIYPVNIHHPDPKGTDTLLVVWYRVQDSISWPYQPIEYTLSWPLADPEQNRVVIASRFGSEGKNAAGNIQTYQDKDETPQNYFDPVRYTNIKLYNQPDPAKPGYNPNEEHAMVAPSLRHAASSPRPFAGYALRNDLNITTTGDTYTSDPYVLVQYYDEIKKRAGMQIYKVEKEDPAVGYTFRYDMKAGEPVEAPYPLNTVISATPPNEIFGKNGNPERKCYWEDHKGQPWAISGAGKYVDIDAIAYATDAYTVTLKPENSLISAHQYMIQVTDATGVVGNMKFQVGVKSSVTFTSVYVDGSATQSTQFTVKLNPNITGLTKDNFTLVHYDSDAFLLSYFWYPLDPSFWISAATPGNGSGEVGKPLAWLPSGTVAAADGFPADMTGKSKAVEVRYDVIWPQNTPILKAGETVTYPGGEYRADNNTDGLPGVLAWGAGQVVFDELNPKMDTAKMFTNYLARLAPILEERTVSLPLANFPETLKPATGRTEVFMGRWYFKFLHAGLKTRIFYDPLTQKLGIRGFVNDKTLGDKTLTASPPSVYVVQPNILTLSEKNDIQNLEGANLLFKAAADSLYSISRNPFSFASQTYTVGLDTYKRLSQTYTGKFYQNWMSSMIATFGDSLTANPTQPIPQVCFGPGIALIPNGAFLNPTSTISEGYITLAENNHPDMGALPVALHIVKVKKEKYRGAIKPILSENVFDEKITLRHTADFGANPDDLVFQWWYREEDGTNQPTPDVDASKWKPFPDLRGIGSTPGLGMTEIGMAGAGAALLTDNLFYTRYRHKDSDPAKPESWSNWAGAANSRPGSYQAQLCEGWVKRVLFAVNPFEARVKNFYNSDSPATYVSMIQQSGTRYEGAVAFNPAKDVIENLGLIELYQTVLNRAADLSINLSQPASTSGVTTALLLAASRIADFYVLLGNEAYTDALDPTIGVGSDSTEYGSLAPTIFTFMNQEPSLLNEELSLLRGRPELGARPTYNRLLWNFTNGQGEVAYALSYNIQDMNKDGFINEEDGRILYPQGHGDAWGHYLTALKGYYDLLTHPYFNWESRAEKVNIQGVVIDVDYLDERKFAEAASSKAKVGKDLINLTYRSKYVEAPDGQWQGYKDTDTNRAWGVTEWGRRAFTGAYLDWLAANAILPAEDTNPNHNPIQKIDRTTVGELMEIASQAREIHQEYDNSNTGLNPIGLVADVVPFDINPGRWVPGEYNSSTHFEQIYERAESAMKNALVIFNYANDLKNKIRKTANSAQDFATQVENQDRDYRNRLIEMFGTPYEGTIGAGKTYPAGYKGPDYFYYNYVDTNNISDENIPEPSDTFLAFFKPVARGFAPLKQGLFGKTGTFVDQIIDVVYKDFDDTPTITDMKTAYSQFFLTDLKPDGFISTDFGQSLQVKFPLSASRYSFQAPADWGIRRAPGEIQNALTELVKAEADLRLAMADYDGVLADIQIQLDLLVARQDLRANEVFIIQGRDRIKNALSLAMLGLKGVSKLASSGSEMTKDLADDTAEAMPKVNGIDNDVTAPARSATRILGTIASYALKGVAIGADLAVENHETAVGVIDSMADFELEKYKYSYEIQQQLKEIEGLMYKEAPARLEIFKRKEMMRQVSDKYRTVLEKGLRLMEERKAFNARVAAKVQGNRYMDMAFRLNMNDALSKYRNMFDMAARYVYMAAKAYDYETNLADTDSASAKTLLTNIVQERTLGQYKDGQYIIGQGGLGDILGRMKANFSVLKTQMGFSNPQTETDRFSLRSELFRIKKDASQDVTWRNQLEGYKVTNLWDVPEFRKFCRPFISESAGKQPGLVIPFTTNVIFGKNFFGWPLSGGDHAYDPTNFATKVRSVGLWFEGYDNIQLAETPRAYLVPAGMDIMLVPNSYSLATREWTVVDQKIPVPLPIGSKQVTNSDWIPSLDSTDGSMVEIRRYSSFRAYHDKGYFDASEMSYDSRLIGRSVWNTRWMLIIPGGTFNADSNEGLTTFIHGKLVPGTTNGTRDENGVKDIKLFFQTYAISGN